MQRDKATRVRMLQSEIEEIQANIASCEQRLAGLPEGEARRQFEQDRVDLGERLAQRQKELADLEAEAAPAGDEQPQVKLDRLRKEIEDIRANIRSFDEQIARLSEDFSRKTVEQAKLDLEEDLSRRQKEIKDLNKGAPEQPPKEIWPK